MGGPDLTPLEHPSLAGRRTLATEPARPERVDVYGITTAAWQSRSSAQSVSEVSTRSITAVLSSPVCGTVGSVRPSRRPVT